MSRKIHIVGNWKMNQTKASIEAFIKELSLVFRFPLNCESWIAPQIIHLNFFQKLIQELNLSQKLELGVQNISNENTGAFTGENSPLSVKDMGASFTLIGHSERRSLYSETHSFLESKVIQALNNDLTPIFCIGETLEERESGQMHSVLSSQLKGSLSSLSSEQRKNVIIAYEPVWAIGTGKTATPGEAEDAHHWIRNFLAQELQFDSSETIILYGGSMKPANAQELLSQKNIDGGLIGGASLKANDFNELCQVAHQIKA